MCSFRRNIRWQWSACNSMSMKIFKMLIKQKQHIKIICTHNHWTALFGTIKSHSCAKIAGVFSEYGLVTGPEKPCLVVMLIQCNLFYRKDYLNNHVNTQNNRHPAGWQIIHTWRMMFKKSACMQYWQFLDKNYRQFSIICSQDVKHVWELEEVISNSCYNMP